MEEGEACNTRLQLGLGLGDHAPKNRRHDDDDDDHKEKSVVCLGLTFGLRPEEEGAVDVDHKAGMRSSTLEKIDCRDVEDHQEYPSKEKDSNYSHNKIKESGRRKLRLTQEQSVLLEDSFKLHSTLNPAQKQLLAEQLNLKPRQVEVWFQNKRARKKFKQTEVEHEFLKKWCGSLRDENKRLKKELQELRSLKVGSGPSPNLYIQLQKTATFRMCPSCENNPKSY